MDRHHRTGYIHFIIGVLIMAYILPFTDGDIRPQLRGYQKNNCAGRVELSNGTRVCGDNWSLRVANTVCTELKCGKAAGAGSSSFGFGFGRIWLKNITCGDRDVALSSCKHEFGSTCSKGDAAVVCSNGISDPDITIHPSAEVNWGHRMNISCDTPREIRSLTKGKFKITKSSVIKETKVMKTSFNTFILQRVTFEDEGQYKCCYDLKQSMKCSPVVFTVTVRLQEPSISVSSPDEQKMAIDRMQVTRGYRFVVVCSTTPDYPEGRFLLWFSGTNSSDSQPAVNNSASFHFPESQSEHQGRYHCVHQVTGAGRTYTSPPSPEVQVTVKQPLLPVILPVAAVSLLLLVLIGVYLCYRRRRRSVIVTELMPTTPSPATTNQYKEDDEEEEADYVNVQPGVGNEDARQSDQSDDEPDYVNVVESQNKDTPDIYGGDDSIYQNC